MYEIWVNIIKHPVALEIIVLCSINHEVYDRKLVAYATHTYTQKYTHTLPNIHYKKQKYIGSRIHLFLCITQTQSLMTKNALFYYQNHILLRIVMHVTRYPELIKQYTPIDNVHQYFQNSNRLLVNHMQIYVTFKYYNASKWYE